MDSDKKGRNMMLSRRFKRLLDGLLSRRAAGAGGSSLAFGLLARRSLGLRRRGCRLAGHYRLRPVVFLWLFVGSGFGRRLRNGGRMELRSQADQQSRFGLRRYAHQELILRVVQKLAELLKAVSLPVEVRLLGPDPFRQDLVGGSIFHLDAVRFEHVAQHGDGLLGLWW